MLLQIDLLQHLPLKLKQAEGKTLVWDIVRKKWVNFSPEEQVRQAIVHYFTHTMHYPIVLMSVEKQLQYGSLKKRYDLVVYDRTLAPWLLVECKAPQVALDGQVLQQLLQYHSQIPCPYWLLSNGIQSYCADARQLNEIKWVPELPAFPTNENQ